MVMVLVPNAPALVVPLTVPASITNPPLKVLFPLKTSVPDPDPDSGACAGPGLAEKQELEDLADCGGFGGSVHGASGCG